MNDRVVELISHACAAKLVGVIAEDADEATLRTAVTEFPRIIQEILRDAIAQMEWEKGRADQLKP